MLPFSPLRELLALPIAPGSAWCSFKPGWLRRRSDLVVCRSGGRAAGRPGGRQRASGCACVTSRGPTGQYERVEHDARRLRERSPLERPWIVLSVALFLVVGFGVFARRTHNTRSVSASETQLRSAYLRPLERSGLNTEVSEVCHYYRFSSHDPWHFAIRVVVGAPVDRVAKVLSATVGVIRTDRDPVVLQQYRGRPNDGWDGTLSRSGTGTTIDLLKNNLAVSADGPGVGWLPVCENTRQWADQNHQASSAP